MNLSQELLHSSNLACCSNPHQNPQSSDYLLPEDTSAIGDWHLCKQNNSLYSPPEENIKNAFNSNDYKQYLCEYIYGDGCWSVEIPARSSSEAQARLKAISHGKVLGEIHAVIPARLGWFARIWVWLGSN